MGNRGRLNALRIGTICAWLVLIVDATPLGDAITFELARLALIIAGVGSTAILLRRHALPCIELFEAGRVCGRREVESEPQLGERRLRVVDRG